jgi:ubiquinone/menaquinone biosynthesis C-methylase UbiE
MTNSNPLANRDILVNEAYATDENLAIRYQTHDLYSRPKIDFKRWVMEAINWRGDEWVLDIGSGSGSYFELVKECAPNGRHVAGDLSIGMVRQAHQNPQGEGFELANFNAQHLPFRDDTFDVVLANHMLYHVPEVETALAEISRVLKPIGCLIAATNSLDTMPEIDTLARRACTLLGYPRQEFRTSHSSFALENGPVMLAHHFRAVARHDLPSAFHFPDVGPVIAYLNSMRALRASQLPGDLSWEEFMNVMEKQITRLIRHFGELQVHKLAGVLVATNGGGFAEQYLRQLDLSQA